MKLQEAAGSFSQQFPALLQASPGGCLLAGPPNKRLQRAPDGLVGGHPGPLDRALRKLQETKNTCSREVPALARFCHSGGANGATPLMQNAPNGAAHVL
eukprot:10999825-Alexandrium_andersonii.AAC.1